MSTQPQLPVEGPDRLRRTALLCVVVLPIVVAVVRALSNHWFPIGDNALLYIRTRDVFTTHHPLLGSWTSASLSVGENMNNPGPMYDFLIAPFAHLLSPGPGAAIGVGAVNIAAILGISAASRHIGGWTMQRWMLLAAAALSWSMGSELLIDIWQAHALLLPFLLFLVLIVGCAAGRACCVPWAVAIASLLIQTHISYAYILSFLIVTALGALWWQNRPVRWRAIPAALMSRTAGIAIAVFLVLWAQPLYEQFFGEGRGNLTRLASNSSGGAFTLGAANAAKMTSALVAFPEWWTRPGFSTTVPSTPLTQTDHGPTLVIAGLPNLAVALLGLVIVVAGLALLTRAAHRRRLQVQACAGVLATVSVVAAVICLSLLTVGTVGLAAHHVRWVWSLAVFVHLVAVWLAVDVWQHDRPTATIRWATPAAVSLIVVLSVLNLPYLAHPEGPVADYRTMPAMRRVFPAVGALADYDPVVYDTSTLRVFEPYSSTMMMRMQELGIEFRVTDEGMVRQLGNSRRANGTETTTVFQLEGVEALQYQGPACTIAVASALSETDEQAARTDAAVLAAALADGTIEVDTEAFAPSDPIDQLGAAREGDAEAARLLVLDGTLARWAREGIATSSTKDQLSARLERIGVWVASTYGLFAAGPSPCPELGQPTGS